MTTASLPMLTEAVPHHRPWQGPALAPDRQIQILNNRVIVHGRTPRTATSSSGVIGAA